MQVGGAGGRLVAPGAWWAGRPGLCRGGPFTNHHWYFLNLLISPPGLRLKEIENITVSSDINKLEVLKTAG